MSHELEIIDGVAQIAYAGELPWHGLGIAIPKDLTPKQILKAAGLDWKVEMRPMSVPLNGKVHTAASGALVRLPNGRNIKEERILTEVRNRQDWHHCQNDDAFAFFNEFIAAGDMEMHTAGSLFDGSIVWALAKTTESFNVLGKKDKIESYLLFTNPHRYGKAIDVRFTPIRVVCNNTLTFALDGKSQRKVTVNHSRKFDKELVMEKLGLAHYKMGEYKEQAQFLAQSPAKKEDIVQYFQRIFPVSVRDPNKETKRTPKDMTKAASISMAILDTQPGADFAPGTWWNAFNATTFYVDHIHGKNEVTRLQNAWYGSGDSKKTEALELALKYAKA